MSEKGLPVFDETLHLTHEWMNGVRESIGADAKQQYHALRSVLFAVRDRLTIEEAFDLSSQLPMLVRDFFWESYRPVHKPEAFRSREEFLDKVAETLDPATPLDPETAARAVFRVLVKQVPAGQVEHVRNMLPEEVRDLFPGD